MDQKEWNEHLDKLMDAAGLKESKTIDWTQEQCDQYKDRKIGEYIQSLQEQLQQAKDISVEWKKVAGSLYECVKGAYADEINIDGRVIQATRKYEQQVKQES